MRDDFGASPNDNANNGAPDCRESDLNCRVLHGLVPFLLLVIVPAGEIGDATDRPIREDRVDLGGIGVGSGVGVEVHDVVPLLVRVRKGNCFSIIQVQHNVPD